MCFDDGKQPTPCPWEEKGRRQVPATLPPQPLFSARARARRVPGICLCWLVPRLTLISHLRMDGGSILSWTIIIPNSILMIGSGLDRGTRSLVCLAPSLWTCLPHLPLSSGSPHTCLVCLPLPPAPAAALYGHMHGELYLYVHPPAAHAAFCCGGDTHARDWRTGGAAFDAALAASGLRHPLLPLAFGSLYTPAAPHLVPLVPLPPLTQLATTYQQAGHCLPEYLCIMDGLGGLVFLEHVSRLALH